VHSATTVLSAALAQFDAAMHRVAANTKAVIPSEIDARATGLALDLLIETCARIEGFADSQAIQDLQRHALRDASRWLRRGSLFDHTIAKPLGYPGDYLIIDRILADEPTGLGLAHCLDRYYLRQPACEAVRSRSAWLTDFLSAEFQKRGGGKFMDLGCGSCRDIIPFLRRFSSDGVSGTCVDFERSGIEYATALVRKQAPDAWHSLTWECIDIVELAKARRRISHELADVVFSIGLFDYFRRNTAIRLLSYLYDAVAPGGTLVIGNFHPSNPTRTCMEWLCDWRLVYRTEADMLQLAEDASIPVETVAVEAEPLNINIFLIVRKQSE